MVCEQLGYKLIWQRSKKGSMKKKIAIAYFPRGLKYATPLVFGAGIYLASLGHYGWCIVLILLGVVILTTKNVTEINLTDKKYNDYLSLLWIPLGEETIDLIVSTELLSRKEITPKC
jgi:hypothetical protein